MSLLESLKTRVVEIKNIDQTYYLANGRERVFFVESGKGEYPRYSQCVEGLYINFERGHHHMFILSAAWYEGFKTDNMKNLDDILNFVTNCKYITDKLAEDDHLIVYLYYGYKKDGSAYLPSCYLIKDETLYKYTIYNSAIDVVDSYVSEILCCSYDELDTTEQESFQVDELLEIHYWA